MRRQEKKNLRSSEKSTDRSRRRCVQSTQQNIPVRELYNGIVITKDGRYVKIMEVRPITFLLLSHKEQAGIAADFRDVLKTAPSTLQLTVITLPADLSVQIEKLKQDYAAETNPACRRIDIEYGNKLLESEKTGKTRRFFLSFEYEGNNGAFAKPDIDSVVDWMNRQANAIASCLARCGNEVIGCDPDNPNLQPAEILYTILNRSKVRQEPFEKHAGEVFGRYFSHYQETDYYVPPAEYLAPETMSFHDRKYAVINGQYYSFACIAADGYNPTVVAGWLTPYINSYKNVDLDIYLQRIPKEQIVNRIRRNLTYNRVTAGDVSDISQSYEAAMNGVNAGYYLKNGLANGEDFYHMAVMITVSGETPQIVDAKMEELRRFALASDIVLQELAWQEEAAFFSSLPLARMDRRLFEKCRRNVLTGDAASVYPFTAFEMNDPDGIYFGDDMQGGSLAVIDIFNQKRFTNSNMFICGQTGAGKTFTLLLMAIRMRIKHIPVYIIAPEKEHEFRRVCTAIGGQFIQLGSGSPNRINIMEIFRRDESAVQAEDLIDGPYERMSCLAEKVQTLKTFFSLLITDISIEEKQLLDEAIMRTYARFGITNDNESLYDPGDPSHSRYRRMPVISDLRQELAANPSTGRLANIIAILTSGSGSSFDGQTNVSLDNEFTVLGLEHLNGDMLPMGIYMAMDYIWSRIKEDRTRKKALFIDEWWKLAYNPIAAGYSLEIAKVIRAYGGSMVIATQQMKDILAIDDGKFGAGVLNNCKIKILMQMENDDAEAVRKIMNLTAAEAAGISRFRKGEGLLAAGTNDMPIRFVASDSEYSLITTDRSDLARMSDERMKSRTMQQEQERELLRQALSYACPDLIAMIRNGPVHSMLNDRQYLDRYAAVLSSAESGR